MPTVMATPVHRERRGRRLRRVVMVLVVLALGALVARSWWEIEYQPQLARQVNTIPAHVHALLHAHHARYVRLAAIAPTMQHAIVAIEDRRFYGNHGIDPRGIARALITGLPHLEFGGATISDQLVERTMRLRGNALLQAAETAALAWVVNDRFSKGRILEFYLNAVYYGRGAFGISAASRVYFHETPRALTVAQAAFLAALPQAPSYYGRHPLAPATLDRWRTVIRDMAALGAITVAEEAHALHRVPSARAVSSGRTAVEPYPVEERLSAHSNPAGVAIRSSPTDADARIRPSGTMETRISPIILPDSTR